METDKFYEVKLIKLNPINNDATSAFVSWLTLSKRRAVIRSQQLTTQLSQLNLNVNVNKLRETGAEFYDVVSGSQCK